MRRAIWDFVRRLDTQTSGDQAAPGLIALARQIALAPSAPTAAHVRLCHICGTQVCPRPVNYLVNGSDPSVAAKGLAGLLPHGCCFKGAQNTHRGVNPSAHLFLGCNFHVLEPLAAAKQARQLCGFEAAQAHGLAILFGTWPDFCLQCWQTYPDEFDPDEGPVLILARTAGPLAQEYVAAGVDWGEDALTHFFTTRHQATGNLFSAILMAAGFAGPTAFAAWGPAAQETLRRFIARKRILVFHTLPWFACGKSAVFDSAGHDRLASVEPISLWLRQLVNHLKPKRIATLGSWAYTGEDYDERDLAADLRQDRPTLFTREFLKGTPFEARPGQAPEVRHFNDPHEHWTAWPRRKGEASLPWFFHTPEYAGEPPSNVDAFVQFLAAA